MPSTLHEEIAKLALSTFDTLPLKCKPRQLGGDQREWTPMSAIILVFDDGIARKSLKCVSLATGTKCLPASVIPRCGGQVLHDCHAEVLSFRGLNYWLLKEMHSLLEDTSYASPVLTYSASKFQTQEHPTCCTPFSFKKGVSIYLYTTTAPCGDASMDILMSSKSPEDAVPWSREQPKADSEANGPLGRGHFSLLGIMRRKPARGDAPNTMSKSCTDKIALKQLIGLLSFPNDLLIENGESCYLKAIITHHNEFNVTGYSRAFGTEGRMKGMQDLGGKFFEMLILPTSFRKFDFCRDNTVGTKATNLSALFVADTGCGPPVIEVLVNGVKQGYKQWSERDGKSSIVSRTNMTSMLLSIMKNLQDSRLTPSISLFDKDFLKYSELKLNCAKRKQVKIEALRRLGGWESNSEKDNFEVKV